MHILLRIAQYVTSGVIAEAHVRAWRNGLYTAGIPGILLLLHFAYLTYSLARSLTPPRGPVEPPAPTFEQKLSFASRFGVIPLRVTQFLAASESLARLWLYVAFIHTLLTYDTHPYLPYIALVRLAQTAYLMMSTSTPIYDTFLLDGCVVIMAQCLRHCEFLMEAFPNSTGTFEYKDSWRVSLVSLCVMQLYSALETWSWSLEWFRADLWKKSEVTQEGEKKKQ